MLGLDGDGAYTQNNQVTYFLSTLYFGSNYEAMPIIWDTGSEWPIVMGYTCSTCAGHTTYDYSDENGVTFFERSDNDRYTGGDVNFGSAQTSGFEAEDQICLAAGVAGSCVPDQHMFIITWQ